MSFGPGGIKMWVFRPVLVLVFFVSLAAYERRERQFVALTALKLHYSHLHPCVVDGNFCDAVTDPQLHGRRPDQLVMCRIIKALVASYMY